MPLCVSLLLLLLPTGQLTFRSDPPHFLPCEGSRPHWIQWTVHEVRPVSDPDTTRKAPGASDVTAPPPPGVPPLLSRLYDARKDMDSVARELDRLKRRGLVPMGKAEDFESLEGLYVAVLDAKYGLVALLRFQTEKFIDVTTGAEVQMTDHAGKRVIWLEVK